MNILITGGTGLIGSHFAKELAAQGHQVRIIHRQENPPHHLGEWTKQVEWLTGDLFEIYSVQQAMKGMDTVIHCAGMISFAPRDRKEMARVNVGTTSLLVDTALSLGVERFVFLSSVSALGKPKSQPILTESVKWEDGAHLSDYARTKHEGEKEVWRGYEEGLPALILNPSIVLGPGQPGRSSMRLLEYVRKGARFFVPGQVNYVDVRDLFSLMQKLWEANTTGERIIASAGTISYQDLFSKIAEKVGSKPPSKALPLGALAAAATVERIRTRMLGGSPLVTRDMVETLRHPVAFDASKSLQVKDFGYRPLDETLAWVAAEQWGISRD